MVDLVITCINTDDTGGPIAITVDRSTLQCAPDSVRFGVDLSQATFDTQGPGAGEVYDARLHDLTYEWLTGDTGTWSKPTNVLDEWRDKSIGRGPWIAHCYSAPGTYNVSVKVTEPSSGKTSTAFASVTVLDADDVYAGAKTVCINPTGDSDFTGKPDGAQEVNLTGQDYINEESWWAALQDGTDRRYLFKGGATYSDRIAINYRVENTGGFPSPGPNPFYGTYGTGSVDLLPPLTSLGNMSGRVFYVSDKWDNATPARVNDFRIQNINVDGGMDTRIEVAGDASAADACGGLIRSEKYSDLVVHNCDASNCKSSTVYSSFGGTTVGSNTTYPGFIHVDDCGITYFGGNYGGLYSATQDMMPDSSYTITGVLLQQRSDNISGGTQWRSTFRDQGQHKVYMRCVDSFGTEDSNTSFKICTTPTVRIGHIVNLSGIAVEGDYIQLQFAQNISKGINASISANIVLDGMVSVADFSANYGISTQITGITIRNMLFVVPNSPRLHNSEVDGFDMDLEESGSPQVTYSSRRFLSALRVALQNGPGTDPIDLATPVRMYNSTLLFKRDIATNGNTPQPYMLEFDPAFTAVSEFNNIKHGAWNEGGNDNSYAPMAPLTTAVLWPARNDGFRGYQTQTHWPEFTSPANSITDSKPDTGSPAIGAATGTVAYLDITGNVRAGAGDIGAWET